MGPIKEPNGSRVLDRGLILILKRKVVSEPTHFKTAASG